MLKSLALKMFKLFKPKRQVEMHLFYSEMALKKAVCRWPSMLEIVHSIRSFKNYFPTKEINRYIFLAYEDQRNHFIASKKFSFLLFKAF